MAIETSFPSVEKEWRRCRVTFPRFGLMLDRDGVHKRLILPGHYLVRHSRTMGRRLYRLDRD